MDLTSELPQGHSLHRRLSYLINKLCTELNAHQETSLGEARSLAQQARQVIDGLESYMSQMSSPHPAIVDKMVEEGNKHDWDAAHREGQTQYRLIPEMSAGGYEAVLLQQIAKISKARRILEIGMFTGTTTIALAMLPSVERVVSLELESYLEGLNRPYFEQAKVSGKIDVLIGDANASLDRLSSESAVFDMVFIDADKQGYISYLRKVLDGNLLARDGFIVADNVAYKAAPWAPPEEGYRYGPVIDAFNRAVR